MKKRNLFILVALLGVLLTGCKEDEDKNQGETGGGDPFEAGYSENTVEENKTKLEDSGIEMVGELNQLKDAEAIDVMVNFSENAGGLENEPQVTEIAKVLGLIENLNESGAATGLTGELKSVSEEPNSFSELWTEVVGRYSWNPATEDWEKTDLADAVVLEFPGKDGDNSNTANITIDGFSAMKLVDPVIDFEEEDIDPELLTGLKVSLKYNDKELASYNYAGSFEENGMPKSFETELKIDDFSWSVKMNHKPHSEAGFTGSFKHNDKVLTEGHMDAEGNWDIDNIEANMEEYKEFMYIHPFTGDSIFNEWTETVMEEILFKGNAYIQLMNIKVAGMIDIKALTPIARELGEKYDDEKEQYYTELAKAMNENARLVVVYADNNQMIAEAELFPVKYSDYWDTYWDLDVRFIFADESKVDAETYFGEGFSELIDEVNKFIKDINADYDVDIEPMEY